MRNLIPPDIKYAAIAILSLGMWTASCSDNRLDVKPLQATPSAVYGWADDNIKRSLDRFLNEKFDTLLTAATLPEDFPYAKTRSDFPHAADIEYDIHALNFKTVKTAGIISSFADFCNLDYKALNFLPLMNWQRRQLPEVSRHGYEIHVLGVAHGYAMGKTDQWLKAHPIDCASFEQALEGRFFSQVFEGHSRVSAVKLN